MGYSSWSNDTYRSKSMLYSKKSTDDIFVNNKTRQVSSQMNPLKLGIREARDSQQHPNSLAVLVALDLTGSMGHIPDEMVRQYLGQLMNTLITAGIVDAQVMTCGIGDHECDSAPLQVGQFECGTEELDKWLTELFIEKGGGGNAGESYLLAWLVAARHTAIDCMEKRGQKGFLFTIGDEPCLPSIPASFLKDKLGYTQASELTAEQLLKEAQEKYHVFHIHCTKGSGGWRDAALSNWRQLLGQNVIELKDSSDVCEVIAKQVVSIYNSEKSEQHIDAEPDKNNNSSILDEDLFK